MGLSQSTLKKNRRTSGFTLVEMLTVCAICSLLLVVIATLMRTGMWEIGRSSGRIEIVRNARLALDQMQRYLSSALPPEGLKYPDNTAVTSAVYTPLDTEIYDPDLPATLVKTDRVRFFTPIDHLNTSTSPGARALNASPQSYGYEIVTIPGANNEGQDIVLRRLQNPPVGGSPLPLTVDTSLNPRPLARRLGIPDAAAPGGYRDGLVVVRLREGAIQLEVNVSSRLVSDDLQQHQLETYTPLQVRMRTIYQPPFYNL